MATDEAATSSTGNSVAHKAIAGVFVVANLLAIGPALVATRSKPATLLRAPQGVVA